MPGHAGSPYWAAVDFDSEGDEAESLPPNNRMYLDPWDSEAYGLMQVETESSQGENFNSFAGEPVSASFYYVPTKNYDSTDEPPTGIRKTSPPEAVSPDYSVYGRKITRSMIENFQPDPLIHAERAARDRRRSMYIEEAVYARRPMLYEPVYGHIPPPPGYLPPAPRSRMSLPHHPEYVMANLGYTKHRRHSRLTDAYEHLPYESLYPEYEDWARPLPKTAPDNFHLSRYGHLQIDYSFSWNSLDRLIRSQ